MTGIGGSDGDGGGSRYQKDLAAAKIAEAKWRDGKQGSGNGQGAAPGGGCLTGFGGCWLISITLTTLGIIFLMVIRLGVMTYENITSFDIIGDYSAGQYFRNIGHMDRYGTYTVNTKSLECYIEPGDALDESIKPFRKLRRGKHFQYRGYQVVGEQTLVAIKLEGADPNHCYLLLPEVWTGKSYWDFGESELLTEVMAEED
ncbi:MAG: hypothetical protein U9Q77_00360 [Candidatus Marinimicrobia bacterium]|nr:hypothetical protein [Candidatus Neomarinimicrobiota bacterium]